MRQLKYSVVKRNSQDQDMVSKSLVIIFAVLCSLACKLMIKIWKYISSSNLYRIDVQSQYRRPVYQQQPVYQQAVYQKPPPAPVCQPIVYLIVRFFHFYWWAIPGAGTNAGAIYNATLNFYNELNKVFSPTCNFNQIITSAFSV